MSSSTASALKSENASPVLLREDQDGICILTLNRPERRNALSDQLIAAMSGAWQQLAGDRSVRVVILAAAGEAYSAGHDLGEVAARSELDQFRSLFRSCSDMMLAIPRLPQPVIAEVQGVATAAGCQLVVSCDLAVASDRAAFATPGVHIGLFCSTPMVALSRNVGRKAAMAMLLGGERVQAEEAQRIGLVNRIVAPERLRQSTVELARSIAAKSTKTVAVGKEAFYRQLEMTLEEAYDYTGEVMAKNMMAADAREGINAFLERRPADWRDA